MSKQPYDLEKLAPDPARMCPEVREIFEYWEQLRQVRTMPAWKEFDWMALPKPIIPWCVVVDVERDPMDFRYRFWGTARTQLQGKDYTGASIRDVTPKTLSDKIFAEYENVAISKRPIHFVTTEFSDHENTTFKYHFLRLPFGADPATVDQILSVGVHEERDIKVIQNFFQPE